MFFIVSLLRKRENLLFPHCWYIINKKADRRQHSAEIWRWHDASTKNSFSPYILFVIHEWLKVCFYLPAECLQCFNTFLFPPNSDKRRDRFPCQVRQSIVIEICSMNICIRVVAGRVSFWPVPVDRYESYFSPNHYSYDTKIPFHYYRIPLDILRGIVWDPYRGISGYYLGSLWAHKEGLFGIFWSTSRTAWGFFWEYLGVGLLVSGFVLENSGIHS